MADTDPPAGTLDPAENLLLCLHWCQTFVARFTMRPVHYEEYNEIVLNFFAQNIPYEEFRARMVALLQQNSNYVHLGVYWDVFERLLEPVNVEEELRLQDNPLFLYPVALYLLLNLLLFSALIRDPLRNVGQEPEQERMLASHRQMSLILSRRYHMAGGTPSRLRIQASTRIRTSSSCSTDSRNVVQGSPREVKITTVLQRSYTINVMGSRRVTSLWRRWECCYRVRTLDQLLHFLGNIHRMHVRGEIRMLNIPILPALLALWVTFNTVLHSLMFGIAGRQHRR